VFVHHCTACDRRQLIFASQLTSLVHTDDSIVIGFECWCGAEQSVVKGRRPGVGGELQAWKYATPTRSCCPTA